MAQKAKSERIDGNALESSQESLSLKEEKDINSRAGNRSSNVEITSDNLHYQSSKNVADLSEETINDDIRLDQQVKPKGISLKLSSLSSKELPARSQKISMEKKGTLLKSEDSTSKAFEREKTPQEMDIEIINSESPLNEDKNIDKFDKSEVGGPSSQIKETKKSENYPEKIVQPPIIEQETKSNPSSSSSSTQDRKQESKFIVGKSFLLFVQNPELPIYKSKTRGLYKWFDCILCDSIEMTSRETLQHIKTKKHLLGLMEIEARKLYEEYKYKDNIEDMLQKELEKTLPENKIITCNSTNYDLSKLMLQNKVFHNKLRIQQPELDFPHVTSLPTRERSKKTIGNLKVLLVGDSRIHHLKWKSPNITSQILPDSSLEGIIRFFGKSDTLEKYDVLILLPLLQELVALDLSKNSLEVNKDVSICDLTTKILYLNKKWVASNKNLSILWIFPQAPDFERLRSSCKEARSNLKNSPEMCWFTNKVEVICEILKYYSDICFLNLLDFGYLPGEKKVLKISGNVPSEDSTTNGINPSKKILSRFVHEYRSHLISENVIAPPPNYKKPLSQSRKHFTLASIPPQCYDKIDVDDVHNFVEAKLMASWNYFKAETARLLQYDTFHPFYLSRKAVNANSFSVTEALCLSKDEAELLANDAISFRVENQSLTYRCKIVIPSLRMEAFCMLFFKCFGNIHSSIIIQILKRDYFFFDGHLKHTYINVLKSNMGNIYSGEVFLKHSKKVREVFCKWKMSMPKKQPTFHNSVSNPPKPLQEATVPPQEGETASASAALFPSKRKAHGEITVDRPKDIDEPPHMAKKSKWSPPLEAIVSIIKEKEVQESRDVTPSHCLEHVVVISHPSNNLVNKFLKNCDVTIKKYSAKPPYWSYDDIVKPEEENRKSLYVFVIDINIFSQNETHWHSICIQQGCLQPLELLTLQQCPACKMKEYISSAISFVKDFNARKNGQSYAILMPFQFSYCLFDCDVESFHKEVHSQALTPLVIKSSFIVNNLVELLVDHFKLSLIESIEDIRADVSNLYKQYLTQYSFPLRFVVRDAKQFKHLRLSMLKEFGDYSGQEDWLNLLTKIIGSLTEVKINKINFDSLLCPEAQSGGTQKESFEHHKETSTQEHINKNNAFKLPVSSKENIPTSPTVEKTPEKDKPANQKTVLVVGKNYLHHNLKFSNINTEFINFNLSYTCEADGICLFNRKMISTNQSIWLFIIDFTLIGKTYQVQPECNKFICPKGVPGIILKNSDPSSQKSYKMSTMELIKDRISSILSCAEKVKKLAGPSNYVLICPLYPNLLFALDPKYNPNSKEDHKEFHTAFLKNPKIHLLLGEKFAWITSIQKLEKEFAKMATHFATQQGLDQFLCKFVFSKSPFKIVSNLDEFADFGEKVAQWKNSINLLVSHCLKKQGTNSKDKALHDSSNFELELKDVFTKEEESNLQDELDMEYKMYGEVPEFHPLYQSTYESFMKNLTDKNSSSIQIKEKWIKHWKSFLEHTKREEWKKILADPLAKLKEQEDLEARITVEESTRRSLAPHRATSVSASLDKIETIFNRLENIKDSLGDLEGQFQSLSDQYRFYGGLTEASIDMLCKEENISLLEHVSKKIESSSYLKDYLRPFILDLGSLCSLLKMLATDVGVNAEAIAHASVGQDEEFISNMIEIAFTCEGIKPLGKDIEIIGKKVDFYHYFLR